MAFQGATRVCAANPSSIAKPELGLLSKEEKLFLLYVPLILYQLPLGALSEP